jgi:hypothetical protein
MIGSEGEASQKDRVDNIPDRSLSGIAIIAERCIELALANGEFDGLPQRGYIDCSINGERFFRSWFAARLSREPDVQSTADRAPRGASR